MAIGLFLAIIVNQKIRGQTFFRGAYYFPAIASSAAITILWIFIVSPFGLFNSVRAAFPLDILGDAVRIRRRQELDRRPGHRAQLGHHPQRLDHVRARSCSSTSPRSSRSADSSTRRPRSTARTPGRRSRQITFPLLRPGHYFVATVAVIGALQLFDQAAIAGGPNGDPNNALMTVVLYLYNAAFSQFNFGYAAAVGVILFVVHLRRDPRPATAVRRGPVMVSDGRRRCPHRARPHDRPAARFRRRSWRPPPALAAAARLRLPDRLCAADVRPVRLVGDHVVQDPARLGPADDHPGPVHARRLGLRVQQARPVAAAAVLQQRDHRRRGHLSATSSSAASPATPSRGCGSPAAR